MSRFFLQPLPTITGSVLVKIDLGAVQELFTPEQTAALMQGVANVVTASRCPLPLVPVVEASVERSDP